MSSHAGRWIEAFAPGSIGNLGSGFDILGMALSTPGDRVRASVSPKSGLRLTQISGTIPRLPMAGERNTAVVAAHSLLAAKGAEGRGVELALHKGLPLSAGMGGSAASAVAAVVAFDALFGLESTPLELLRAAMDGEAAATGSPHPDNAASSLLGGIVLIRGGRETMQLISLPAPSDLFYVLVHPHLESTTREGRSVLPTQVSLSTAVRQWGNVAGLVAALYQGDLPGVGRCTEDLVAEPARAPGIPGFYRVKSEAEAAGALGVGISGSGPSVFSLGGGMEAAEAIGLAMIAAFEAYGGVGAELFVGAAASPGARIVGGAGQPNGADTGAI